MNYVIQNILEIFQFFNIKLIVTLPVLLLSGFYIRFLLEIFGQTWIRTKAHTTTLILLPIITYVITNVISGNIALSLGMVGALSIVRFRNPVKSPLELTALFNFFFKLSNNFFRYYSKIIIEIF